MSVTLDNLYRLFDEVMPLENTEGATDRFSYAKAKRLGEWFFVKIALTPESAESLKNEYLWSEFMDHVDTLAPSAKLKGAEIVQKIGTDALVFKFIDAPMVAGRGDASAWRTNLDRFTDMLVKLDKLSGDFSLAQSYTVLSHPYEAANANWRHWVEGKVDSKVVEQAKQLFKHYERFVTLRLQHNDMSPWQIFDENGTWVIIDGEKADLQSPRFNDVAQSYVRMHNTARDAELASEFLAKFLEGWGFDTAQFYNEFIPILTLRAVGSLADSAIDRERNDFTREARELVEKCLSRDPKKLSVAFSD